MSESRKTDSSIVFKLNMWFLSHVFFKILIFNAVIIILAAFVLFSNAEKMATSPGIYVSRLSETSYVKPFGAEFPQWIKGVIPPQTRDNIRTFKPAAPTGSFWMNVRNFEYRIWVPGDGIYVARDYPIGYDIILFIRLFIALLVFELFSFVSTVIKGNKAVRKALRPIAQLTETARSFSAGQDIPVNDLKGTIAKINAAGLDTRINPETTQSELKELVRAVNGMLDRINASYRSQIRFVSDASHELRTPIAVIQGYANLLDRWGKNDQKALQESIEAIKAEAENMKELVEQLLFLARGDNNSMQLSMEDIHLSHLAEEVVREAEMIDKGHTFSSHTDEDLVIVGDAQLIKQAIRIFVDNSIKYTPAGEHIRVSAVREGKAARLVVQDNGIGIPSEDLPYVFDRFFRSDDSRARKTGGTGLGLAIAKWIIERHHGAIEILSRKDFGTRVTITLRCKPEPQSQ